MKVVTFGEIMLRLAPEGYLRFTQADKFGVVYGGGEANVSVSLANYGLDSAFVTKLPKHEIGQAAVNSLRRYGVDTSMIVRGGDRVGIYSMRRAHLSVRLRLFTTALTRLSLWHSPRTSIGKRSLMVLTGSTSPESLPLLTPPLQAFVLTLVSLQRLRA